MRMKRVMLTGLAMLLVSTAKGEETMSSIYDIPVNRITGEATTLRDFAGQVLLIVNTASKCGFTRQYDGLQALHTRFGEAGLAVLGFPSNDFGRQEPGSEAEILEFCETNFGVTFPMFEKVVVKPGTDQHPLYRFLTEPATNPEHAHRVGWNFNKFLVGRDGTILGFYGSRVAPESDTLTEAIEAALGTEQREGQP